MRYCVLSTPRSGSTWLTNGIGQCFVRLRNNIDLNEFFTPFVNNNHYRINDDKMIYVAREITDKFEIDDINEFNKLRMDILLNGSVKQSLVLKYMYWPYQGVKYNDLENLKKIQDHNITIVNLNRDAFESAVSFYVAKQTGISHRFSTVYSGTWYQTDKGKVNEIPDNSVTVDIEDFIITYVQFINAFIHKQKMADMLNCTTVNYNSLRMDCFKNEIPLTAVGIKKLYDKDYSSIITNYDQLLEAKRDVEKKINYKETK